MKEDARGINHGQRRRAPEIVEPFADRSDDRIVRLSVTRKPRAADYLFGRASDPFSSQLRLVSRDAFIFQNPMHRGDSGSRFGQIKNPCAYA
jgi:hypothetical protein